MGTCTYTLAKTCGSDTTLPAFHITAKNENQGKRSVSFIGFVTVQVYGYHISVARKEYGIVRVRTIAFHCLNCMNQGPYQARDEWVSQLPFCATFACANYTGD